MTLDRQLVPVVSADDVARVEWAFHDAISETPAAGDVGGIALDETLAAAVLHRVRAGIKVVDPQSMDAVMVPEAILAPTDEELQQVAALREEVSVKRRVLDDQRGKAAEVVEQLVDAAVGGEDWIQEVQSDCKMVAAAGKEDGTLDAPTKQQMQTAMQNYVEALSSFCQIADEMGQWKATAEEVQLVLRDLGPKIQGHTDRIITEDIAARIAKRRRRSSML